MHVLTPDWVKDAVFYQIFPDRFATSSRVEKPPNLEPWEAPPTTHGFKGGDLLGVVEHLDYLADLGVNAIYFTPVFQSAANHRYHTYDYYLVDPPRPPQVQYRLPRRARVPVRGRRALGQLRHGWLAAGRAG